VLPSALNQFTHAFLLANIECQAFADSDTVNVHIEPVTATIAIIASILAVNSISYLIKGCFLIYLLSDNQLIKIENFRLKRSMTGEIILALILSAAIINIIITIVFRLK
jgi:hypothetical protein